MTVVWTALAEQHLDTIHAYLAATSEELAEEWTDRITERTKQLEAFPESGQLVPRAEGLGIRQLVEGSYRIIYVVSRDHIEILGIVHARRDLL